MIINLVAVSAQRYPIEIKSFAETLTALGNKENSKMFELAMKMKSEQAMWTKARKKYCFDEECNIRMQAKVDEIEKLKANVPEFIRKITWGRVCLKSMMEFGPAHVYNTRQSHNGFLDVRVTRDIVDGTHFEIILDDNTTDVFRIRFKLSREYLCVPVSGGSTEKKIHTTPVPMPTTLWKFIPDDVNKMNQVSLFNIYNEGYLYQTGKNADDQNRELDTMTHKDTDSNPVKTRFELISC